MFLYESLKKHVFYVFFIFNVFCVFNVVFFVVFETKTYKISNTMHFSWAKTPFPGQSECFQSINQSIYFRHKPIETCSSIIDFI